VFHFVGAFYLATEFLYVWISTHFQKHFIRIGDGQGLFNQAMLHQNAMIRMHCESRWMGRRNAVALFWVFHCTMLTRFPEGSRDFGLLPACHKRVSLGVWVAYPCGHRLLSLEKSPSIRSLTECSAVTEMSR
jgi:hypothetical protein